MQKNTQFQPEKYKIVRLDYYLREVVHFWSNLDVEAEQDKLWRCILHPENLANSPEIFLLEKEDPYYLDIIHKINQNDVAYKVFLKENLKMTRFHSIGDEIYILAESKDPSGMLFFCGIKLNIVNNYL